MGEPKKPQSRHVGDFEIVREIGRVAMGIVYEARQVSLNRRVALKVLGGGLGLTLSPKAVLRFRRDAEAAAKLHYTNIVPIYATGEQDGTHYYAMELVEGPSLNVVVAALKETSKRQNVETSKSEPWAPAHGQLELQATKRPLTPSVKGRLCEEATKGIRDEGTKEGSRAMKGRREKSKRPNVETSISGP